MFFWRQRCERRKVLSLCWSGMNLIGGGISVETVYREGNRCLLVANPCWVSWDTGKDPGKSSREFFAAYLDNQRERGVDYVVGCAHKRYTEVYWNHFLKVSGYSFFLLGEYRLLFFIPGNWHKESISEGEVRLLHKDEVGIIQADIERKKGFVPEFSSDRWWKELYYPGCVETWVYEKEGEIRGWVNGWRYSYLENGRIKRGIFLRWFEKERLSHSERQAMITLLASEWGKARDMVTMPEFILGSLSAEQLGFVISEERYIIFAVDLQKKGEKKLVDFGSFFVF